MKHDREHPARQGAPLLGAAVAVALLATPAGAADCSALTTGIDRGKLVYYVEDGLKADRIGAAWDDLGARMFRAEEWMASASWRNTDLGEAVVNARRVAELVKAEVPRLDGILETMPDDGPEFPPVFYWFDGWRKLAFAVNDSLLVEAGHIAAEADAFDRGDLLEAARIFAESSADEAGFQAYFNSFDARILGEVPKTHPEHWLIKLRTRWNRLQELRTQREQTEDELEMRELTLQIAEEYGVIAEGMEADIAAMRGTLAGFRGPLGDHVLTLTCDAAAADRVLADLMASLERHGDAATRAAALLREYAVLEREAWRDGLNEPLMERYEALNFRYDQVYDEMSAEWSVRAQLLADAVYPD